MTAISHVKQLGKRYVKRHWLLINRAVEEIFKGDSLAVFELREIVKEWPQKAQLLFYHNSPFNVAADICAVRTTRIKKKQMTAYQELMQKVHTEELFQFLKSRKGPVKLGWAQKIVFGSDYDTKLKSLAPFELLRSGKIAWVKGQLRVRCTT